MEPAKEPSTSFNVVLSPDISERLRVIQGEMAGVVKERRNYDNSPHLAILTKFMRPPTTDAFAAALVQEFKNDPIWELEFADFAPSENGTYIFLNLAEPSRKHLFALYERAVGASEGIGSRGRDGAPPKYQYDPHVSIVKLEPEELPKVLELIVHDLSGIKMSVTTLEVTRQETREDGFSVFPVVATIELKK